MKRKVLPLMFAAVLVIAAFSGCSLFAPPVLYITAAISTSSGSGLATVTVKKDSSGGTAVTDATVKLNGFALAHAGSGLYGATVSGVTEGLEITLVVDAPDDYVSETLAAPASGGGVSTIPIADGVAGSSFTITCY